MACKLLNCPTVQQGEISQASNNKAEKDIRSRNEKNNSKANSALRFVPMAIFKTVSDSA